MFPKKLPDSITVQERRIMGDPASRLAVSRAANWDGEAHAVSSLLSNRALVPEPHLSGTLLFTLWCLFFPFFSFWRGSSSLKSLHWLSHEYFCCESLALFTGNSADLIVKLKGNGNRHYFKSEPAFVLLFFASHDSTLLRMSPHHLLNFPNRYFDF